MSSLSVPPVATSEIVARAVTDLTIVNSTAETDIFSVTVPANTMGIDKILRATILGELKNDSGVSQTFRLRIKFGGTVLYDYDATAEDDSDRRACLFLLWLANQNASNDQIGGGFMSLGQASPATVGIGAIDTGIERENIIRGIDVAIDTTVDQTFVITGAFAVADVDLEYTRRFAILEVM